MAELEDEALLHRFSAPVAAWFREAFAAPSPPQRLGWPAILAGEHVLITAPTGSGKTLAAFLCSLDRLTRAGLDGELPAGVHTLYLSPLKALGYDVERNLRAPLHGIRRAARALGLPPPPVSVAVRTGDTTPAQRRAMIQRPPHILITTPESLFLLLSSPRAREMLRPVRQVIVDEIHALCGNKRGMSLTLSLERLTRLTGAEPQRIGLSATVRPLTTAARFLGGLAAAGEALCPRAVTVVDAGQRRAFDLQVITPVPDLAHLPGDSIWPAVHARLLELIRAHRSTLIFVRMRAQAERISRALNELAGGELTAAHHGSIAPALRRQLEERLKRGELPALLSTGTLELGIDMGAIDLVVQLGSPGAVLAGLQRVGRAGHLLGAESRGRLIPLHREDLVECAVVARRMLDGEVEAVRLPGGGLDVLAQHLVSAAATGEWTGAALLGLCRQAAPYHRLGRETLDSVLHLLSGRTGAEVIRGLGAKLVWERHTDRVAALPGARQLVVTAGGTIPDLGPFALHLADGTRLGELEEEFVYERSVGDVIAFGTGTWRILEIGRDRVVAAAAPGQPAVIPFWKGGIFGRDPELSRAIGAFRRELFARVADEAAAEAWLREAYPLDEASARNLVRFFADQRRVGGEVGTDRTVVVETSRDDLGDHRLIVHAPLGNRLNAPWALALRRQLRARLGVDPQVLSDDGAILVRLPEGEAPPPLDLLGLVDDRNLEELVLAELPGSALFGTLFRQNAARFLVLGRKGGGRRTPLWLQRLRSKDLLEATAELPDFPVRLETYRECLQEVMDLPRLTEVLRGLRQGEMVLVKRQGGLTPAAAGVLARFIGKYMYEYDEPRAERTLRGLTLDRDLLDQVLGREDLSGLLLPAAITGLERSWQGQARHGRARSADELLATLLRLVALREGDLADRCQGEASALLAALLDDGRAHRFRIADRAGPAPAAGQAVVRDADAWICASEDLPLLARAHHPRSITVDDGTPPLSPPASDPPDPASARSEVLRRMLGSLGPIGVEDLARRSGLAAEAVGETMEALLHQGHVLRGQFLAGAATPVLCTRSNLEQIRRRSLILARRAVEAVEPATLQRLVLEQQRLGSSRPAGRGELLAVVERLGLCALPAALLERELLPARLPGYQPDWLDELCATGEVLWTGAGVGQLRLLRREHAPLLPDDGGALGAEAEAARAVLAGRGASFFSEVVAAVGLSPGATGRGLWELLWAGQATNDRFAALRQGLATGFVAPAPPTGHNLLTGRPGHGAGRRRRVRGQGAAGTWSGRWSLLPSAALSDEVIARAWIEVLLGRHGLLARELLTLQPGPRWSALYPVLRRLELGGELRRGVFVRGLRAAQFAPVAGVDRLRALGEGHGPPLLLSSCDPALVAPALGLPLPGGETLVRRPSSHVILEDGRVVGLLRSTRHELLLEDATEERQRARLALLPQLLQRGRRSVELERINGASSLASPLRDLLEALGFRQEGKRLCRRRFG